MGNTSMLRGLNYGLALALVAAGLSGGGAVRADVKILQYDKSGKASIKRGKVKGKKGAAASGKRTFSKDRTDPINHFEPGELVILDPPRDFATVAGGMGYRVTETVRLDGLDMTAFRIQIPRGYTVPDARAELASRFPGATIDANHRFEPQARKVMHARAAMGWANAPAACGRGVRLGQIDSGVDTKHLALKGQGVKFRSFHRKGRRPGPKVHGTAIAAMLVGRPKWGGLLPGATLYAASMFETKKDGTKVGSAIGLLKFLSWLAKNRVHAINLSIAGTDNKTIRLAFNKAKKIGLVLIAAAGNWGRADRPAFPAAYKHVLAVTAVNAKKLVYSHANRGKYIDFAAPGVRIYAAVPGGAKKMSGTSFATPYITAMLATKVATGTKRRASALRGTLKRHVEDLGKPGKDSVFGYGLVKLKPRCK